MSPALITIAIGFPQDNLDHVDTEIGKLSLSGGNGGNDMPQAGVSTTLRRLSTVHFMSIVAVSSVCPAYADDKDAKCGKEARLMIEITADGEVAEVLAKLARADVLGGQLKAILNAAGVSTRGLPLASFLHKHHRTIRAAWTPGLGGALGQVHNGAPGMSVRRIRGEYQLASYLGDVLSDLRTKEGWRERSPLQRLSLIRQLAWQEGSYKWAFAAEPAPCLAGDPTNPWNDSGYNLHNPQAVKALGTILNGFLWPLYLPLILALWLFAAPAWHEGSTVVALLWTGSVAASLLALVLLGVLMLYLRLRDHEIKDPVEDKVPPVEQVEKLMERENFCAQNHMATVSELKEGWLRRLTLRVAFLVVGTGRFVGAPGFLGKNGVIHSARWMLIPGTSQLMFWSNYDGTWESYVADFIADAPTGVTAIWSNCKGFPRTSKLFHGGAEKRDLLVQWARRQQQPTLFWYSDYPELSATRIRSNAAIRQGLASAASDADARDWLSLFGSSQRPPKALVLPEIPTLVLGGLSTRKEATCLLVRLSDDPANARRWLKHVAGDTTFGEASPGKTVVAVAFAASGLSKLGLPRDALQTFATPFQQDMWRDWRARALGDVDNNAPSNWTWGGDKECKRPDVVVLIYPHPDDRMGPSAQKCRDSAKVLGHDVIGEIPIFLDTKGAAKGLSREPFGFTDGVSQPVIRGAPRNNVRALESDLMEPGEFLLGYPDNVGEVPPSPMLADKFDPEHVLPDKLDHTYLLPDQDPDAPRRRPEFSRYEGICGQRDLGANGTYLVIRQLRQDRKAFNDWSEKTCEWLKTQPWIDLAFDGQSGVQLQHHTGLVRDKAASAGEAVRNYLKALLVGRWQDGTSLVRNPHAPGSAAANKDVLPDNAFRSGAEDPSGFACPFGSHVRRANPRDTRFHSTPDESKTEIDAVNRHRILRIGRRYGDRGACPDKEAGLMFMCMNADIERQFEFIQKSWLLNRNIQGLEDETDPLVGVGRTPSCPGTFTVPTPTGPVELKLDKDFVQVVGGGYFFMPGRATLRYLVSHPFPQA